MTAGSSSDARPGSDLILSDAAYGSLTEIELLTNTIPFGLLLPFQNNCRNFAAGFLLILSKTCPIGYHFGIEP